jgi:hypothetical protein
VSDEVSCCVGVVATVGFLLSVGGDEGVNDFIGDELWCFMYLLGVAAREMMSYRVWHARLGQSVLY